MTVELTKIEFSFFETIDLLCRLKLGASDEARATDDGVKFVDDCFELLCNIMSADSECFHKLCAYYRTVNDELAFGAEVDTDEALATKHLCEMVFKSKAL